MHIAIILTENKTLLTIPLTWIYEYKKNLVQSYNGGARRWKKELIFYSTDAECEPDFDLEIQRDFDPSSNACYIANILKAFEEEFEAKNYVDLRCPVLPIDYSCRNRNDRPPAYPTRTTVVANNLIHVIENIVQTDEPIGNDTLPDGAETLSSECVEGFVTAEIPMPIKIKTEDALSGKIPFVLQV